MTINALGVESASISRRLPIYILIDTSESMIGEPLEAVNRGLNQLCNDLRNDPLAIETAWLSVITFDSNAQQLVPLTDVLSFSSPKLYVGPGTSMGAAFAMLAQRLQKEVRSNTPTQKGDWKPLVFLLTDGMPTDEWRGGLGQLKRVIAKRPANIIAVGCGEDVDVNVLREITNNVLMMKNISPGGFTAFFKWVSASVRTASVSASMDGGGVDLPAPPAGEFEFAGGVPGTSARGSKPLSQIILAARCRDTDQAYLMRYRRMTPSGDVYKAAKAYPVGNDYFVQASKSPTGQQIEANKLNGAPPCPHCGRLGWTLAEDKVGLICNDRLTLGGGQAQVMFVLDVTGSMMGEIKGVKNSIKDFVDYIRSEGLSVEVGLIAFRDLEMREPPKILKFAGQPFTDNAASFKSKVGRLRAHGGGGNIGESSLDALALACRQPFRGDVSRILVLITDEPPLIPDGEIRSLEDAILALSRAEIDQLYIVVSKHLQSTYQPLLRNVKGQMMDLGVGGRGGKAFRNILMDIGKNISVMTRLG